MEHLKKIEDEIKQHSGVMEKIRKEQQDLERKVSAKENEILKKYSIPELIEQDYESIIEPMKENIEHLKDTWISMSKILTNLNIQRSHLVALTSVYKEIKFEDFMKSISCEIPKGMRPVKEYNERERRTLVDIAKSCRIRIIIVDEAESEITDINENAERVIKVKYYGGCFWVPKNEAPEAEWEEPDEGDWGEPVAEFEFGARKARRKSSPIRRKIHRPYRTN